LPSCGWPTSNTSWASSASKQHADLKKRIRELKGQFIKSTSAKFRVNNLAQKFATYERLWMRTLQEIENGTYRRDVLKAKRRKQAEDQGGKKAEEHHFDEDIDLSDDDDLDEVMAQASAAVSSSKSIAPTVVPLSSPSSTGVAPVIKPLVPGVSSKSGAFPAASPSQVQAAPKPSGPPKITAPVIAPPRGAAPAARAPAARGAAPVSGDGALSDQKVKAIYDAYVMAKKRCGEDTRGLSLDSVSKTLRSQVPTLIKQHNAKSVEFKVVIKDGKAVLRALPKL
jgi:hypothetical protein